LPTKLNEELKPFVGKDFDMDIVEEGEKLKVVLTRKKDPQVDIKSNQATSSS
jgi:hypothetical protein